MEQGYADRNLIAKWKKMKGEKIKKVSDASPILDYEKQRLEKMKNNAERMEAQGLGDLAHRILLQKTKALRECGAEEVVEPNDSDDEFDPEDELQPEDDVALMTSKTNVGTNTAPQNSEGVRSSQRDLLALEPRTTTEGVGHVVSHCASSTKPERKQGRGFSRGVKTGGQPKFLEFDSLDNYIGKWSHEYGKQIGACAIRTDINIESYSQLDEVEKNKNWEEAKRLFNIDDPNGTREKKFHELVGARFRDFKSKLRRRWLKKKRDVADDLHAEETVDTADSHAHEPSEAEEVHGGPSQSKKVKKVKVKKDVDPWVAYEGLITEDQWKTFAATYETAEFQAKSQKGSSSAKQNKHPHHLGQKSYSRAEVHWIKTGRLPSPPSSAVESSSSHVTSIPHSRLIRPIAWKLAHEKKLANGSWGIDPKHTETCEVVQKIDKHLEIEAKAKGDGTYIEEHGLDALSKAIGKRDHRGRVKAIGGLNVGIEQVFGKAKRRTKKNEVDSVLSQDDFAQKLLEIKADFEKKLQQEVAAKVEEAVRNLIESGTIRLGSTEQHPTPPTPVQDVPTLPPLKGKTPCKLCVRDTYNGNLVVVADGTVHPSSCSSFEVMHNRTRKSDSHWKVSLDYAYREHRNVSLPEKSDDGETTKVGDAEGHFLQWPKDLVLFEEDEGHHNELEQRSKKATLEVNEPSSSKGKNSTRSAVGSCDGAPRVNSFLPLDQKTLEELGEECQLVHLLLSTAPDDRYGATTLQIKSPLFYYEKDGVSIITREDIEEFLKGVCINVSCIHIYQMFLMDDFANCFNNSFVSFMCPQMIHATNCHEPSKLKAYFREAFIAEKNKKEKQCKFILAPYHEENHWMLLVIELQAGQVFVFNSNMKPNDNPRMLKVLAFINLAYQIYKANDDKHPKTRERDLRCVVLKCPQQTGGLECGYYVMKYMLEIVTLYSDCKSLKEEYFGTLDPYTNEEINVIREQWAKFFRTRYLSSS